MSLNLEVYIKKTTDWIFDACLPRTGQRVKACGQGLMSFFEDNIIVRWPRVDSKGSLELQHKASYCFGTER